MNLSGITVEEAIRELQKCNPKALVVVPAGEGTICAAHSVAEGKAYEFLDHDPTYGMSRYNFELECDLPTGIETVEAVYIH